MAQKLYFALLPKLVVMFLALHIDGLNTSRVFDRQQLCINHRCMHMVIGQVMELRLINADTDLPIVTLLDGMIVNIAIQNTTNFNIEAVTDAGIVGSIQFTYNGLDNFRIESERPFALCGDGSPVGNYRRCKNLVVGQHTVTATAYSGVGLTGTVGNTVTVTFTFISEPGCKIPKFLEPSWQSFTPDYPIDTTEPMGLIIGDDMVSFSGFINSFRAVTNQTFARDITNINSTWRRMDDMPLLFDVTHAATAVVGTKVYLCGGYRGAHPGPHTPLCYAYDHSKNPGVGQQWTKFADIPKNGTAGAGMVYDARRSTLFYAAGGQRLIQGRPQSVDVSETWKFNFIHASDGWVSTNSIPHKANHLSAVTAQFRGHERHFMVGGQISEMEATGNLADVFEFFASNETYVRRASMPYGRSHTTISTRAIGCGFIVAGGSVNGINGRKNRTNNILYYDIPTNSWTPIGHTPYPLATPLVDIHQNGYMYFVNDRGTSRRPIEV